MTTSERERERERMFRDVTELLMVSLPLLSLSSCLAPLPGSLAVMTTLNHSTDTVSQLKYGHGTQMDQLMKEPVVFMSDQGLVEPSLTLRR